MTPDPILDALRVQFFRGLYFVLFSLVVGALLFWYLMFGTFEIDGAVVAPYLTFVCVSSDLNVTAIIMCLSLTVGALFMTVVYLTMARWWKRRSELPRRGARLESEEVGK